MNNSNDDRYIGVEEAAKYLGLSPITLRKWLKQKKGLPSHQIGKLWKFKKTELDAWVKSGKSAADSLTEAKRK